ncbi:MAG TPA: TetR/AcrR family transcriptional regulator [Longimicrobiales bacterium]
MTRNAAGTRTAILDAAENLVMSHGFGGTSVDAILERTGLTKGAFFHHFPSKSELAHALVDRYAQLSQEHLEDKMARAERMSRDPLQQVLIFIALFEEEMAELAGETPGCLFAAYCYQSQLFDERIHGILRSAIAIWGERIAAKLEPAIALHPPKIPVDVKELSDAFLVVLEGAYVVSRTMSETDGRSVAQQLRHYRNYLELLFDVAA